MEATFNPRTSYFSLLPPDILMNVYCKLNVAKALSAIKLLSENPQSTVVRWLNETQRSIQTLKLDAVTQETFLKTHGTSIKFLGVNKERLDCLLQPIEHAPNLRTLVISFPMGHNYLTPLIDKLNSTSVEKLIVDRCFVSSLDCSKVARLTNLTVLKFDKIQERFTHYGSLSALKKLRVLQFSSEGVLPLLTQFSELTHLELSSHVFSPSIFDLIQLTTLKLQWVALSSKQIAPITRLTNLLKLKLNNMLESQADRTGDKKMERLSTLTRLTNLDIGNNRLSEMGLGRLHYLTNLTKLKMEQSEVVSWPLPLLTMLSTIFFSGRNTVFGFHSSALKEQTQLTSLSISDYDFRYMSSTIDLMSLTQLNRLSLRASALDVRNTEFLTHLTNLRCLDLSQNDLLDDVLLKVSNLTSLHTLNLSNNKVFGVRIVRLQALENLTDLDISNNPIAKESPLLTIFRLPLLVRLGCRGISFLDEHVEFLKNQTHLDLLDIRQSQISPGKIAELTGFFATKPTQLLT